MTELSIVIPCFNGVELIEKQIHDWLTYFQDEKISAEFIVVNDGSKDGTGRVLDKLRRENKNIRVFHQLKTGFEIACRRGIEMSRGNWILIVDPMSRFEPSDFECLWRVREHQQLVLGQLTHVLGVPLKKLTDRLIQKTAESLFGPVPKDPHLPFRLYWRASAIEALKQIPKSCPVVNLAMTLYFQATAPEQIAEAPVPFRPAKRSLLRKESNSGFLNTFKVLYSLIQLKFNTLTPNLILASQQSATR